MKTTNEIRKAAIQLINKAVVLKANIADGCFSDQAELTVVEKRLEGVKNWANENNQLQEIKHYMISKNWGQSFQFAANEISTYFHN